MVSATSRRPAGHRRRRRPPSPAAAAESPFSPFCNCSRRGFERELGDNYKLFDLGGEALLAGRGNDRLEQRTDGRTAPFWREMWTGNWWAQFSEWEMKG